MHDRPGQEEIGASSLLGARIASLKVKGQKAKVKGEVLGGTSPAPRRERSESCPSCRFIRRSFSEAEAMQSRRRTRRTLTTSVFSLLIDLSSL